MHQEIRQDNKNAGLVPSISHQTNVLEGGIQICVEVHMTNTDTVGVSSSDADRKRAFQLGCLSVALDNCNLEVNGKVKYWGAAGWLELALHGTTKEQDELIYYATLLADEKKSLSVSKNSSASEEM